MKKSLIGISMIAISSFSWTGRAWSAEELLPIEVTKGESLMDVIHRTHPCPFKPGDESMQKVLRYNPESLGADGKFTLTQKEIRVPKAYLESANACREVAVTKPAASPAPALQAEGHEGGGGKAVALEPEELSKREQGEEPFLPNALRLGTFLEFSKLSANGFSGETADLTSKPEYGLDLEYDRWINRALFVGAHFRYTHSAFQELEDKELIESSSSLKAAGLTAGYDLGKKTFVTFDLSAVQIDHVIPGVDTVNVSHVWVPKLSFGVKSVFAEVGKFAFGGGITASLDLPAAGAKTSPAESAQLFIEHELNEHISLELGGGAQFVRQGFEDESHSATSYGADLGIGIHF